MESFQKILLIRYRTGTVYGSYPVHYFFTFNILRRMRIINVVKRTGV